MLAAIAAPLVMAGCGKIEPANDAAKSRAAARAAALTRQAQAACSSPATYDRLKQVAFDQAIRLRNNDPVNLDTLSRYATVRMENPVVKSRDETLGVTVCSGRFILQVPPGAESAFAGQRQLEADIEYAAQVSADGSGLVYQMRGAEPIVYKLAAFDLKAQAYRPAVTATQVQVAEAAPAPQAQAQAAPPPPPAYTPPAQPPLERIAPRPSFNCRNARTRSEHMVCDNPALATLDRAMAARFYAALDNADARTRADLRRSRDRFLAYRERCSNDGCIAQAYRDRMDEIADIAEGNY